jgi:MurNAc alpha-1-phosphate uridylyltransferase
VYCPHFPFATLLTALEDKDVWGNPYPPDQRDVAWVHLVKNPAELEGDFALSSFALANQGAPLHTFADIGIYRPEMFDAIKPGEAAELGQLLRSYAERGQVGGDLFRGDWLRVASGADLALLNAPYTPPSAPSGLH